MEIVKNFVDNIHNEAYKDSYHTPCPEAESYVIPGGRQEAGETGLFGHEGILRGGKKR
ncbi:hypothetical protein [Lacrimispora brassicae]